MPHLPRPRSRKSQTDRIKVYRSSCENWGVRKYAVVIHEDPEAGVWVEVPALPGCYSQGETIDVLLVNVREAEAIEGVLEVMKEQGRRPESNIHILDVAV